MGLHVQTMHHDSHNIPHMWPALLYMWLSFRVCTCQVYAMNYFFEKVIEINKESLALSKMKRDIPGISLIIGTQLSQHGDGSAFG